jgi:hypothetical protein
MASVLAAGGFPEEAPSLLATALRCVAAARGRAAGNAEADPGRADPGELRAIAAPEASREAVGALLESLRPGAAAPTASEGAALAQTAAQLVFSLWPVDDGARADRPVFAETLAA